ncbi:MAG: hypothetical protein WC734_00390 [Patescibacteria group bacterium]|jgi:hypothetical protein
MPLCIDDVLDKYYKGWIDVKLIDGTDVKLCYKTIVDNIERSRSKNRFLIREGKYSQNEAEVLNSFDSRKIKTATFNNAAQLKLSRHKQLLNIDGVGSLNVILGKIPIPLGCYHILIPTYPHDKIPKLYLQEELGGSRFAETWFELRSTKSVNFGYFLHFGKFSEGCVTVPYEKYSQSGIVWNSIYHLLLSSRVKYSVIGTLNVID